MGAKRKSSARKQPSRSSLTKGAADLNALRIEAGKRGEGWCGCKWKWSDDLVGSLVSECAYHADLRDPPPPPKQRMCVECRWIESPTSPTSRIRGCASPLQPLDSVDGGRRYGFADVHRNYDFLCGKNARWFEAAPQPTPDTEWEMPPPNKVGAQAIISPEPRKTFLQRILGVIAGAHT